MLLSRNIVAAIAFAFLFLVASMSASWACSGVTGVVPSSGPAAGGNTVTISGDGFHCATVTVSFGAKPATSFTVLNDTTLTAVVPAGTGLVDVIVSINGTPYTLPGGYTYASPNSDKNADSQTIQSIQSSATTASASLSAQTMTSQIDGAVSDAFSEGGSPVSMNGSGMSFNFTADQREKSAVSSRADEAFAALAYANNKAPAHKGAPVFAREWSAWLDLRGTGFENNAANVGLRGEQYNVTGGVGRKLTHDLLVGIVAGYEHMKYDFAAINGSVKGDGGSVGGYLGWRIVPGLRFDAALTYGHIAYSAAAGTASGSFNGDRIVASGGLTGKQSLGAYVVEPSARIYALWEKQGAWTDSLGTAQAERAFSAGRASGGGRVLQPLAFNDLTVTPYVGFYGDYRFASDRATPAGNTVVGIGNGWSGRVTSGIGFTTRHGALVVLGGEYGGLGASYKVWTGNIRGSLPF